jgi:hypothetical protein
MPTTRIVRWTWRRLGLWLHEAGRIDVRELTTEKFTLPVSE